MTTKKKAAKRKTDEAGLVRRNIHLGPEYDQVMARVKGTDMTAAAFIRQAVKKALRGSA